MPELSEQTIIILLVVASIVAVAVSYLRLPYTIALVVVGLVLGFGGALVDVPLTRDLILLVFLPPLLFEGALNMDLDDLRRRAGQVATLAGPGTLVTVAVLTPAFVWLTPLGWAEAGLLGVMIAPTDPVSVLAIFKEHGVGAGLRTLMEGESIFNDAISIVLFVIAADLVGGEEVTFATGVFEFVREVAIGVAAGFVVGFIAHRLMRTVEDHLVEITISLVTAFGSFLLADGMGGSGVIATVGAGLLIGNYGTAFAMSPQSRIALVEFWEVIAFMVNSLLFLLLGAQFDVISFTDPVVLGSVALGVSGMLLARVVIAYGLLAPFRGEEGADAIPPSWRHAVFWGGLRGAIPIALVLGLEDTVVAGVDLISVVFGVVLFSLLAQGLTYRLLLQRLGLTGASEEVRTYEEALARAIALRASLHELERINRRGDLSAELFEQMREDVRLDLREADQRLAALAADSSVARTRQVQQTARRLANAQRAALSDAGRRGQISDDIVRSTQRRIASALRHGALDPFEAKDEGLFPEEDEEDADG